MEKFSNPLITAKGETRASVELGALTTLWINTGTVCNLSCTNCYIESSPRNDRLAFINEKDVSVLLDEVEELKLPVRLIGLTGGEPFVNPHIIPVLENILGRNLEVLVLTNGLRAIRKFLSPLTVLLGSYGEQLKLRISLDHYSLEVHEKERGANTFEETLKTMKWLVENGFCVSIAGRSLISETPSDAIQGYQELLRKEGIPLELRMNDNLVIFPEMDQKHNVPEISQGCWNILGKKSEDQMCASERMIVKKKGEDKLSVMPCTLLAYDEQFILGHSLKDAKTKVYLNHPFCAKFCVLGGASCSSAK